MRVARPSFALLLAVAVHLASLAIPASAASPQVCDGGNGLYPADCPRFGQPGNYLANNGNHHVDFHNTLDRMGAAAQWVLSNRFPDVGFKWTWVDGSDYDVRIRDGSYPNAQWYGKTSCPTGATIGGTDPRLWCHGQILHLNLSNEADWDATFGRRVVLCHELGHSIGLNHPDGGYVASTCLENRDIPDRAGSSSYDDIDQVNITRGYS